MYSLTRILAVVSLMGSLACGSAFAVDSNSQLDMKNTATPMKNLTTGGQPSIEDLRKLANSGTKVVVNLRTKGEFEEIDEQRIVEELGMKYISIEVDGSGGINLQNAKTLDNALNNLSEPVLVHCASSNRVGGLLAYRAFKLEGQSAEDALELGKAAGMRSTEKKVKSLIALEAN